MKPFFTLFVSEQHQELSEKFLAVNSIAKAQVSIFNYPKARLIYNKGSNPAFNSDLINLNQEINTSFFGFGTIISKTQGLLGKKFDEKVRLLYSENKDFKFDFVNGVYVGILFNHKEIRLFNDFFALSPTFYFQKDNTLIVSSSFQQLYKLLKEIEKVSWNRHAIKEYLSLGKTISGNTLISPIKMLLPSREIIWNDQGIQQTVYRKFPDDSSRKIGFNKLVEESAKEVKDSVNRMYDKEYKYCLSLSGGSDSRLVFFHWPERESLLTETMGDNTNSDVIKAKQLISLYGNIKLFEIEQGYAEKKTQGLFEYLNNIDYIPMAGDDNIFHLDWKLNRNADIRFGGTDGELLGGENLYLSRKPWYVFREGFCSYPYSPLPQHQDEKTLLITTILYKNSKASIASLLPEVSVNYSEITQMWDEYLGKCNSKEVYTERFRTWHTVIDHNYHFSNYFLGKASLITPFQDFCITDFISSTHPKHRELRKIQISLLKKFPMGKHIPIDTTHLKINRPYFLHKFFRMLRFVMNIGFRKRVPLIQKGTPLATTIPAFYLPENQEFRQKVLDTIRGLECLDKTSLNAYLEQFKNITTYNHFSATHEGWPNLFILLRLAVFEKKLKNL